MYPGRSIPYCAHLARSQTRSVGRRRSTIIAASARVMPTLASLSPSFPLKLAARQPRARNRAPTPPTRSASIVAILPIRECRRSEKSRRSASAQSGRTTRPAGPATPPDRPIRLCSSTGRSGSDPSLVRTGRTTRPAGPVEPPARPTGRSIRLARVRRRGTRTIVLSHRSARASPERLPSQQLVRLGAVWAPAARRAPLPPS